MIISGGGYYGLFADMKVNVSKRLAEAIGRRKKRVANGSKWGCEACFYFSMFWLGSRLLIWLFEGAKYE